MHASCHSSSMKAFFAFVKSGLFSGPKVVLVTDYQEATNASEISGSGIAARSQLSLLYASHLTAMESPPPSKIEASSALQAQGQTR